MHKTQLHKRLKKYTEKIVPNYFYLVTYQLNESLQVHNMYEYYTIICL